MEHHMTRILQISDLHIDRNEHVTQGARQHIARILEVFGNDTEKPWILISGDVVDDGREDQFLLANSILQPLREKGFEIYTLPGNHDYGWNGNFANPTSYHHYLQYIVQDTTQQFPMTYSVGKHFVVMLDSMRAETGFLDHFLADGEIGPTQLNALDIILMRLNAFRKSGSKVIVALHHHPFLYPDNSKLEKLGNWFAHYLKDGEDLLQMLAGRTDVLLFGHEHRHIDFRVQLSDYALPAKYDIPIILSCGSSSGIADPHPQPGIPIGRHSWLLTIDDETGHIDAEHWN